MQGELGEKKLGVRRVRTARMVLIYSEVGGDYKTAYQEAIPEEAKLTRRVVLHGNYNHYAIIPSPRYVRMP